MNSLQVNSYEIFGIKIIVYGLPQELPKELRLSP